MTPKCRRRLERDDERLILLALGKTHDNAARGA